MRAFALALALTLPIGLTACADSATEEAYEEGAPVGDREDVIGDGEVFDEPGEPDAGVLGDGLVGSGYDTDNDMMISEMEYDAGIGDGAFATYDTDGDGFLNEEEYVMYENRDM